MAASERGKFLNKVAFVTGAATGIGRATAFRLAREGVRVMIADYVPEGAERVVKAIKESGGDVSCVGARADAQAAQTRRESFRWALRCLLRGLGSATSLASGDALDLLF